MAEYVTYEDVERIADLIITKEKRGDSPWQMAQNLHKLLNEIVEREVKKTKLCDCGRRLSPGLCGICDNDE